MILKTQEFWNILNTCKYNKYVFLTTNFQFLQPICCVQKTTSEGNVHFVPTKLNFFGQLYNFCNILGKRVCVLHKLLFGEQCIPILIYALILVLLIMNARVLLISKANVHQTGRPSVTNGLIALINACCYFCHIGFLYTFYHYFQKSIQNLLILEAS